MPIKKNKDGVKLPKPYIKEKHKKLILVRACKAYLYWLKYSKYITREKLFKDFDINIENWYQMKEIGKYLSVKTIEYIYNRGYIKIPTPYFRRSFKKLLSLRVILKELKKTYPIDERRKEIKHAKKVIRNEIDIENMSQTQRAIFAYKFIEKYDISQELAAEFLDVCQRRISDVKLLSKELGSIKVDQLYLNGHITINGIKCSSIRRVIDHMNNYGRLEIDYDIDEKIKEYMKMNKIVNFKNEIMLNTKNGKKEVFEIRQSKIRTNDEIPLDIKPNDVRKIAKIRK